jgi:hypothetical protein
MTGVIVLFVQKRLTPAGYSNYSVQHSTVKALFIVKLTKTVLTILLRGS